MDNKKYNPGYCPICGNTLCGNLSFQCGEECIFFVKGCLQLKETARNRCHCDIIDIIKAFGLTPSRDDENVQIVKEFLRNGKPFLNDDLFEI